MQSSRGPWRVGGLALLAFALGGYIVSPPVRAAFHTRLALASPTSPGTAQSHADDLTTRLESSPANATGAQSAETGPVSPWERLRRFAKE